MSRPVWLMKYANQQHLWREVDLPNRLIYERQVGLVESAFDTDGVYFGGRADICHTLDVEIRTTLSPAQLTARISLAWAVLRLQHPLLTARVLDRDHPTSQRCLVVSLPTDIHTALAEARKTVVSLLDHEAIDTREFRRHNLNTARTLDPEGCLSRLYILPLQETSAGRQRLRLVANVAHMIADGVSLFSWWSHVIDLLNVEEAELKTTLYNDLQKSTLQSRLPPAQEDLYPPVAGSKARQNWFWAIARVLRHVRKPLPQGFTNPLRRREWQHAKLDSKFLDAFDYNEERLPPMNSDTSAPQMSVSASRCLATLCKKAGTSVGAGVFALVAISMMEMDEELRPSIPPSERQPFIASFPLNPRPFFNYNGPYDSCMLAFSDGIVMPFLPSSLPLDGRIRLLAKIADRQLKSYQKRKAPAPDAHSPLHVIARNYLSAVERADQKLPPGLQQGINPQGELPAAFSFQRATCGVSSVGSVKHWFQPGKYNLIDTNGKDLVADYRDLVGGVRARDNEFLCGSTGTADGRLAFAVSYDLSSLDETLVSEWERRIEQLLEVGKDARL